MMTVTDRLVSDYLGHLRAATADLPPAEREELVASIAEHITTSLADLDEPGEADVRTILDRLGDPRAIAAEARGQSGGPYPAPVPPPERPGALEWVGVAMLGLGSYLLPVIGTVAGLVLVSMSKWWTTRQKAVAIALSLSGLIVVPLLLGAVFLAAPTQTGGGTSGPVPAPTAPAPSPS
jgi:uncharacterized membrane protein